MVDIDQNALLAKGVIPQHLWCSFMRHIEVGGANIEERGPAGYRSGTCQPASVWARVILSEPPAVVTCFILGNASAISEA